MAAARGSVFVIFIWTGYLQIDVVVPGRDTRDFEYIRIAAIRLRIHIKAGVTKHALRQCNLHVL